MNCNQFHKAFDEAVESRLPLSSDVLAHAETCSSPSCRERWSEHCLLKSALSGWRLQVPEFSVVDAVVAELNERQSSVPSVSVARQRSASSKVASVAAVAAVCLTIGVVGILASRPMGRPELVRSEQSSNPQLVVKSAVEVTAEEFDLEAMTEFGRSYGAWVQGTAAKLGGTMTVVFSEGEDKVVEPAANWFFSLSKQLETLDKDFDSTIKMVIPAQVQEMNDQTNLPSYQQNDLI